MTTFTTTWNAAFEALPPDTGEAINLGPSRIRTLKESISERLEVDHSWAGDANDGAHKKVTWIEQGSDPATPAAGQAALFPSAVDVISGSSGYGGLYTIDEGGFIRPGLDGGVVTLDGTANSTLTKKSGQTYYITPTAARTLTLPTTGVGKGWKCEIFNAATGDAVDLLVTVNASGGLAVRTIPPGHSAWFRANQDTPTTPQHWDFEKGTIYVDEDSVSGSSQNVVSFSLPAYSLKAAGSGLRITASVEETATTATLMLRLNGQDTSGINLVLAELYELSITVWYRTSTTAHVVASCLSNTNAEVTANNLSSLDFAAAQTLALRNDASGTLAVRAWSVELF